MHHHEESCKDLNNSKIGNWRYFNKKVVEICLHGGRQRFHGIACSIYVLLNLHAPSRRIMQGGSQTSLKSSAHRGYVVRLQSQIKHTITICKVLYMRRSCQISFQNFFCHLTWEKWTRIPQHHHVNKFLFNKPLMPSRERSPQTNWSKI